MTFKAARSDEMEKPTMITAESVKGLSEKWISWITGKKLCWKVHNATFTKKAVTCPVQAKYVQLQH